MHIVFSTTILTVLLGSFREFHGISMTSFGCFRTLLWGTAPTGATKALFSSTWKHGSENDGRVDGCTDIFAMVGMVESQPYCSGSNILPSRMPVTCCCLNENQEPCMLASHFDTFGCRHPSQDFSSQVDQVEDAELYILKDCVTQLDGQGFIT